ncbi:MAG: hypothetical protein EXR74_01175 [Bdellovibrionales bacterium]|nr:hypothetical protein [Bdellovibrionales bacterium]
MNPKIKRIKIFWGMMIVFCVLSLSFFSDSRAIGIPLKAKRVFDGLTGGLITKTNLELFIDPPLQTAVNFDALQLANQFIIDNPGLFSIKSYHQLKGETYENPLGTRVNYQVFQNGTPILGFTIQLTVGVDHQVSIVSNEYHPIERVEMDERYFLSVNEILEEHNQRFKLSVADEDEGRESHIIIVGPSYAKAEMGTVVSVIEVGSKQKAPIEAVFSSKSGQLLARRVAKSEFH